MPKSYLKHNRFLAPLILVHIEYNPYFEMLLYLVHLYRAIDLLLNYKLTSCNLSVEYLISKLKSEKNMNFLNLDYAN